MDPSLIATLLGTAGADNMTPPLGSGAYWRGEVQPPTDRSIFKPQPFPTVPKKKDPETDLATPPPVPATPQAVASPLSNPYTPNQPDMGMLLKGPVQGGEHAPFTSQPPSDTYKNPFEGAISDVALQPSSQRQDLLATLGYKPNKNYELDPRMNAESRWQARQQDAQDYSQQQAQPKGPPASSYAGYTGSGAKVPVTMPESQSNPVTLATPTSPEGQAAYNQTWAKHDQMAQQSKEASRQKLVQLASLAQQFARAGRLSPVVAARLAQQAGLPSQQPPSSPLVAAMTGR